MKKVKNRFSKNLRYLCLTGVIALGLMTIIGTGGGGGSSDGGDGSGDGGIVIDVAPGFDATAGDIDEDGFLITVGSASFTPPTAAIVIGEKGITKDVTEAMQVDDLMQAQVLINSVPWISQVPPSIGKVLPPYETISETDWYNTANCGPASYLMVESVFGSYPLNNDNSEECIKALVKWLDEHISENDYSPTKESPEFYYWGAPISVYKLAETAQKRGLGASVITTRSLDGLWKELKKGHPVIVRVLFQSNTNNSDLMKVSKYGHYMLLLGMDEESVYLNDAGKPPEYRDYAENHNYGRYRKYDINSFLDVWSVEGPQGSRVGVSIYPKKDQPPLGIVTKSLYLVDAEAGEPYYATLSATGGVPPYSWSISNGSLPNGLELTPNGTITGIPTLEGDFEFTIKVTDSSQDSAEDIASLIISSVSAPLTITASRSLPTGWVGLSFNTTLSAAGGKYPYYWSIISENSPSGLHLTQEGKITGTPSVAGTYNFKVQLADSSSPQQIISKEFVINILPSSMDPIIHSLTANPSTVSPNDTSTITCNASDPDNNPLTYSWSATNGSISGAGLTVTWTAPASAGTYTVTCTASDGEGGNASKGVNIDVTESTIPLSITTTTLLSGTVGVSYGTNLSATGGKTPYTWSVISGSLPTGLSLSTSGLISGTPTTAGTYNFTVKATDSSSPQQTDSKALSIVVNLSQTFALTVTKAGTGSGTVTSLPAGINCGAACSASFDQGTSVTLTATPATGSTFAGWGGACTGTGTCNVIMDSNKTATATFNTTTDGILSVTPSDRFDSSGTEGGPFIPSSKTYTLSNTGGSSINWTASKGQNWVSLSATSGALSPGGSTTVTISINSNANSLAPGNYVDIANFTNTTNGNGNTTRTVNLTVNYSTPTITIGPTSLNFGDVPAGTCNTAVFAIQHVAGTGPASGTVSASPNPPFNILAGSNFSVSNGSAVNVTVQFCPTSAGTFNGTATVSSSATFTGTNTVTLTGIGSSPTSSPTVTTGTYVIISSSSAQLFGTVNSNGLPTTGWFEWGTNTSYGNTTGAESIGSGTSVVQMLHTISGFSPNTTYHFRAVAQNSAGTAHGNDRTFTTAPSNPVERITNGSFSSGTSGWTLVSDFWAGTNLTNYRTSPGYAAGGVDSNGYAKNNAYGYIYQTVTIPSNATSATLSFWYNITSQESGSTPYDVLNVTIQSSTGSYLATVAVLSNLNKGTLGVYNQKTFDVTPYKEQTIRVHFLATTDSSNTTIFRIDDVSLMADGN